MGFWELFGKAVETGVEKLRETSQEYESKHTKYEGLSDSQLFNKYKEGGFTDKLATKRLLEERGYGHRDED